MAGNGGKRGDIRQPLFSFSHYLLISMIFLILVLAIGITYFDYRQAEETYQKSAHQMQDQTEQAITQTVRIVDDSYELYDKALNFQMEQDFSLFLREYERAGCDPARMDLQGLKKNNERHSGPLHHQRVSHGGVHDL